MNTMDAMDKTQPYLDEDGTLVIPFECGDHTYKYWKQEGRSLADILAELGAGEDVWVRYTHAAYCPLEAQGVAAGAHPLKPGGLGEADRDMLSDDTLDNDDALDSDDSSGLESFGSEEADLAQAARMA
ncbi:MAG: hypothetical protein KUA35_12335 [Pseudodesulfovibrio sp.]|uniref:Uncharacterized protein n=1 Tax=Pseudodesulfovibrio aespoeensis (strain ATCC 700646 / DSM 10631 / Aspo-2) TaxID=643562 RepID=E6VTR6_PSEA9|nr:MULTISPECIES: hypothetical protein [Pseudodesulfovibrio]MBU4190933.1 hypothetical protein [Pseudomonadota bacterium]ADU63353.1 hypothetical protein Daes_2348 [Pseudodesulfovibrio aespoeensis Aspo-2]MBU4379619.1 hypothetical protein [Pseudomonadota bacterium]MBU4476026.1 hypothetical protein [Pseudomonadota bacterium]MBU4517558.1 hypothetical protein [Pseudomonadota bacterium]